MRHILIFLIVIKLLLCFGFYKGEAIGQEDMTRQQYLQQLLKVLPKHPTTAPGDQLPGTPPPHISPDDFTWRDWLDRTGELPPDFDDLPFLPFLPDPLILDEGGENIPVETTASLVSPTVKIFLW